MRVTFLTHYFPPEVGAPQARISGLAERLACREVEVTVHTTFPHYPGGRIHAPYRNRPLARERHGAVSVARSAVYPAANRGFARRIINHFSFAASSLATAPLTAAADVVVTESPPLFTAAAGVAYARAKGARLVVNVADRWPASAVELGVLGPGLALRGAEALERLCYRPAAAITVPTAGLVADLEALPEASGKVVHMPPSVELEAFAPVPPPAPIAQLRAVYAGTVGLAQGLDTLAEAARRAGPDVVELRVAGDGAEAPALRSLVDRDGLEHVRLVGVVPHSEVAGLYARADAAVVLLRDRPIFAGALPTKLLEAMAVARPVILSARGEAARLVEEAGAGIVVPPEDPAALANAFEELAADPDRRARLGRAGRRLVEERFGREQRADEWWALLQSVVEGAPLSRRAARPPAPGARRRAG